MSAPTPQQIANHLFEIRRDSITDVIDGRTKIILRQRLMTKTVNPFKLIRLLRLKQPDLFMLCEGETYLDFWGRVRVSEGTL